MMEWYGEEDLVVQFTFRATGQITVSTSRLIDECDWEVIEEAIHQMGCPDCLRGDWPEQ